MNATAQELDLIRDYEAQIALYKVRIEHLEGEEKRLNRLYEETMRLMYSKPEELLAKLTIAGFPAISIETIYETLDEWHREGGTDSLIDWLAR